MRQTSLDLLLDNLANLGNRIHAIEVAFIDYTEENPKSSDQWQEERLRALEHQVQDLRITRVREDDLQYDLEPVKQLKENMMISKADIEHLQQTWRHYEPVIQDLQEKSALRKVDQDNAQGHINLLAENVVELGKSISLLERRLDSIVQGNDTRLTKLENAIAELSLALGNLSKEVQDIKK